MSDDRAARLAMGVSTMNENDGARYALVYSDGSMNVLGRHADRGDAEKLAIRDDANERDPAKMTTVAAVLVTTLNDYGKPALRGDGGSRALNDKTMTVEQRALKIAVAALERVVDGDEAESLAIMHARDELARVRALVPEIG